MQQLVALLVSVVPLLAEQKLYITCVTQSPGEMHDNCLRHLKHQQ